MAIPKTGTTQLSTLATIQQSTEKQLTSVPDSIKAETSPKAKPNPTGKPTRFGDNGQNVDIQEGK